MCDKVFDKQKGLHHHLYIHLSRGDIEPKENDQDTLDTNQDNDSNNKTLQNVLDVHSTHSGNGSNPSMDSSSLKRKRRRCRRSGKSGKSGKHRSRKQKTHGIGNLVNDNAEFLDVGLDGIIGDETEEMAVDDAGAEQVVNEIMDMDNDNVSIEEFMEDLPIQDEPEEPFQLNDMDIDEEEEDIWKVPSDELFLEPDYLMKCMENHFRKKNQREDLPIEMRAAIDLLSLLCKSNASLNLYNQIWKWIERYYVKAPKMPKPPSLLTH